MRAIDPPTRRISGPAMHTQIGIVGAGPAGMFLAHLLHRAGIEAIILEARSRVAVEETLRAGVLEHWVGTLMAELGLGARLIREAHFHDGITLQWNHARHHLDFADLTGGKRVTVYPQHDVLKDLIGGWCAQGGQLLFEAVVTAIDGLTTRHPTISFRTADGEPRQLTCDYVVAADGFHGPGRQAIPPADRREHQMLYPFGWLGILVEAPRSWHELIYAHHEDGFALLSTRSPEVQRLYIQCDPDDDIAAWPDARIWQHLQRRLAVDGWRLIEGPVLQKGIVALRSFVCETMQYGRLFLAGDAAHIVPPTGAKGLNLAVADAVVLARALSARYRTGTEEALDGYSATCLRRVWLAERFSWYMTGMLHSHPQEGAFERRIHLADLELVRTSRATATALAENYVGLPLD